MSGTSSHHTVTLKSKGMKRVNSVGTGDHYIHLKISIPKKLSEKQKALIQVKDEILNQLNCHYLLNLFITHRLMLN